MKLNALLVMLGVAMSGSEAPAQTRWVVDSKSSLVWWQLNPHFGHLWASTCPQDPSWQFGEGGKLMGGDHVKARRVSLAEHSEKRIPLYPRGEVTPICGDAVRGEFSIRDTATWRGVTGRVAAKAETLLTGQEMRDNYARKRVYEVDRFPEIRFHLDSITQPMRGETLSFKAFGTFEFRGTRTPVVVPMTAVRESQTLRVRGRVDMPASVLTKEFGISKLVLGLGAGQRLWKTLHWGMDLILRQE